MGAGDSARRRRRSGRWPARRLGSSWLIAEADLAAWEPKWDAGPRGARRAPDPAAGPAIPDAAPLERAALEGRVVRLAAALAAALATRVRALLCGGYGGTGRAGRWRGWVSRWGRR